MNDPIEESVDRMLRDQAFHGVLKSFLVTHLRAVVGGEKVYIAKAPKSQRLNRDQMIRQEFTGANHGQLAVEYGITERRVRQIVARPAKK